MDSLHDIFGLLKTIKDYYLICLSLISVICVPPFAYLKRWISMDDIKIICKAVVSFPKFLQRFVYFLFFLGFAYTLKYLISFVSSDNSYLLVIGFLSLCIAILMPAIADQLRQNDIEFEKDREIEFKKKKYKSEKIKYELWELFECLHKPDRYWNTMIGDIDSKDPIYLHSVPDFIYEVLEIPNDKRLSKDYYHIRNLQPINLNHSFIETHHPSPNNKYRPSKEEVRNAVPKLIKAIEDRLKPYVDPLLYTVEDLEYYTGHIFDLLYNLNFIKLESIITMI